MPKTETIIGLDIGGTKCAVLIGSYDGDQVEILQKEVIPTEKNADPYRMIDRMIATAKELLGDRVPAAIGVSCGGPLDSKRGIIQRPPNLPTWDDVPITRILSEAFGAPAHLQNDANACALAEWKLGAGRGTDNMIFLTFGTGLGAGLILDGRLYTGTNDMAGEVGHVKLREEGPVGYGKVGSFEGFCSGAGLAQLGYAMGLAKYQMGQKPLYFDPEKPLGGATAKTIADAVEQGDETAREVYRACGRYLGVGLSMLVDILNPECIVLGSVFARSRELLWPDCKVVMERETLPMANEVCRVVPAQLSEHLGDYAALITAVYNN